MTMTVDLGTQLEKFVAELIENGRYQSKSEVLREGVRLVQDRERRLAVLEAALIRGLDDVDAGRVFDLDAVAGELPTHLRQTDGVAEE